MREGPGYKILRFHCLPVCTRLRVPQECGVIKIWTFQASAPTTYLAGSAWWQLLETLLLARRGRLSSSTILNCRSQDVSVGQPSSKGATPASEAVQCFRNIHNKERFGSSFFPTVFPANNETLVR